MAKTLQKSTGVVTTPGRRSPRRLSGLVCKLNVIKIIIPQRAERGTTTPPSRSASCAPPAPERKNTCRLAHRRKCKWLTPVSLLLFRIVSTVCNHTHDSGLMREITISGLKYFSSDYMVSRAKSKRDKVCNGSYTIKLL